MYPPTKSESSTGDSSSESSAGPSRKRCRESISPEDSVEEDIDANELADIEADATAVEVAVDKDVKAEVDAGIGMEVDVGVDVEDEVEDEVESNDRGTIEVKVDVVLSPDLIPHMNSSRGKRTSETEQRELEARSLIAGGERASLLEQVASLERSNARLRSTMMMERARADRFRRRMIFMESELRQIRKSRTRITRRGRKRWLLYEATPAANALEAESQSQNGSDGDNGNGGNENGGDGNGGDGNGGNGNGVNGNPNENNKGLCCPMLESIGHELDLYVRLIKGAPCTQRKNSKVLFRRPCILSWADSISPKGFLSPILLWVVIMVAVVIVIVRVVVVVEIIRIITVVAIIRIVVAVDGVSSIFKLSFTIIGFLY
ncbi:hypothetical protein Tco_1193528 [Tanacetum coccineum]